MPSFKAEENAQQSTIFKSMLFVPTFSSCIILYLPSHPFTIFRCNQKISLSCRPWSAQSNRPDMIKIWFVWKRGLNYSQSTHTSTHAHTTYPSCKLLLCTHYWTCSLEVMWMDMVMHGIHMWHRPLEDSDVGTLCVRQWKQRGTCRVCFRAKTPAARLPV